MKKREIKQIFKGKNVTKAMALITAAAVFATSVNAYTIQAEEKQAELEQQRDDAEEDLLTKVLDKAAGSVERTSSDTGKEETVYILSDANGNVNETIVSAWLKNPDGSKTLEDVSDLKDIENIKGDETFSQNGENVTWNADGSDIYYQGKTDKKAPVDVKITYFLNDKEVSPKEIAGKSGQVKIRFDYTNTEKETVSVKGKDQEVYVPFAVITGMVLPVDNFTNISVTNGKVMSEGNNNIVVGLAFPGLKDSLDVTSDEIDVPNYVEVTANAEDFSLDMTLTVAMSDILNTVNISDDIDFSDLGDKVDALTDATDQLMDGSDQLANGTKELKNGTKTLADGANTLNAGMGSLTSGASALAVGINEYTAGVGQLSAGISKLKAGTDKLNKNVPALKKGVADLKAGSASAKEGAAKLVAGYEGENGAIAGTQKLTQGASQFAQSATQFAQGAAQVSAGLSQASGAISALSGMGATMQQQAAQVAAQKAQLEAALAAEADPVKAAEIAGQVGYCKGVLETLNTMQQQLSQATAGDAGAQLSALSAGITQLSQGSAALTAGAKQLSDGSAALSAGMTQLYNGTKALSTGLNTLDAGLGKLNESSKTLADGVGTLDKGAGELKQGVKKLTDNSAALVNGGSALVGGTAQVANAVGQIADGAVKLDNGAGKLTSGASELSNGMVQFNEEGIAKITGALDLDGVKFVDKLKAIMDAGKGYQSFDGISDGIDGTVKFVIKTEGVKAE